MIKRNRRSPELTLSIIIKLEGSNNAEVAYNKGLSWLCFLWFRSFYACNRMLQMLSRSVVESASFCAVVCWAQPSKSRTPTD